MQRSVIKEGHALLYFCYDVSQSIHLDKVQEIVGKRAQAEQLEVKRIAPEYIKYPVPPVLFKLGSSKIEDHLAVVEAKVYDFGVIVIRYKVPIKGELSKLKEYGWDFIDDKGAETDSRRWLDQLTHEIAPAVAHPTPPAMEKHVMFLVNQFKSKTKASALLEQWRDLGAALVGEREKMSDQQLKDSVKRALSYFENDLVIIGPNASFIYEPTYSSELLDVIEYAVIELLELRTHDALLEKTLDEAYGDIASRKNVLFDPHLNSLLKRLNAARLDIVDVIDKVENSLKLFGDRYLVKVYNHARSRFGLDNWKQSVESKLDTVMDTYSVLSDQLQTRRFIFLEILIVVLFVIDILIYFIW